MKFTIKDEIVPISPVAEGGSAWHILGGYAIMFFGVEIYPSLRKLEVISLNRALSKDIQPLLGSGETHFSHFIRET